ncbi:MAG: cytochrome c-type biogenesis protein [Pseudomonadota bacterium]
MSHSFAQEAEPDDIDMRTREVSETLRCVVCKNQSIADSDAGLAKDLRNLVRERIKAGDTNEEAQAYVVDRYGEFVLLRPTFTWQNFGLWFGPLFVLLLAIAGGIAFILSRKTPATVGPELTPEERAELDSHLGDRNQG